MRRSHGLLCAALLGCAAAVLSPTAEAATKIKLSYTAATVYLSSFIAKDQGFFEKHGLDVDLALQIEHHVRQLVGG